MLSNVPIIQLSNALARWRGSASLLKSHENPHLFSEFGQATWLIDKNSLREVWGVILTQHHPRVAYSTNVRSTLQYPLLIDRQSIAHHPL